MMSNKPPTVSIDLLDPDSVYQVASQEKLIDLALKISTTGMVEPIIVRENNGRYHIMMGNSRYFAAKLAGLTEVEIFMIPDSVEDVFNLAAGTDQQQKLTDIEKYVTLGLLNLCGTEAHKHSVPFL